LLYIPKWRFRIYRIKPDIVAPGLSVESARSNGDDGQSCEVTGKIGNSIINL